MTTEREWVKEVLKGREQQVKDIGEYLGCNAEELWSEIKQIIEWDCVAAYERGMKAAPITH